MKAFLYNLKNPENLEKIEREMKNILGEKVELTKSDMLFRQMKQPLEQVMQVVKLMLYLTLGTSAIVITLLLCMWMRVRKKEIAVYISLGKTKCSILSQLFIGEFFGICSFFSMFYCYRKYFSRKIERPIICRKKIFLHWQ